MEKEGEKQKEILCSNPNIDPLACADHRSIQAIQYRQFVSREQAVVRCFGVIGLCVSTCVHTHKHTQNHVEDIRGEKAKLLSS